MTCVLYRMDQLKKHAGEEKLPEVKNIAMRFEEKIYTSATSQVCIYIPFIHANVILKYIYFVK